MAREQTARERNEETSLLNRRSYLRLAGAAAASVATFGKAGATESADGALLEEEFATSDYDQSFTSTWRQGEHDSRVESPVNSGSHALQVDFPEGSHYGISTKYDPVKADDASEELQELYASYWVRFSPEFDGGSDGSKLPGPMNTEPGGGKGGEPSNGTNGWSARGSFRDAGSEGIKIGYYTYHMDMNGSYGDYFWATTVPRGEWVKVDQHIKLNTVSGGSANGDGQLRMWVNDKLAVDRSGMRFTEEPERGVNYQFASRYGGNETSPKDQTVYFDRLVVGESKPSGSTTSDSTGSQSDDGQQEQGSLLEVIAGENTSNVGYEFTVDGSVRKRTTATDGGFVSESNDSVTDNGDGTVTVSGTTGNGHGDAYFVDGNVISTDVDESKMTLRYDGAQVSPADITAPVIDRFDISQSEQLGDDRMYSVNWAVSDDAEDLDIVEVVVVDGTTDIAFSVNDVKGANGSGWDLFQFPNDMNLTVSVRVKDQAENVITESKSVPQ